MGTRYQIECPYCGLRYDDLRTGLTYQEVYQMYWMYSSDPRDWKYKRRHTILGKWHQIKLEMWEEHIRACEGWVDCYEEEERISIRSEHHATLADLEFP